MSRSSTGPRTSQSRRGNTRLRLAGSAILSAAVAALLVGTQARTQVRPVPSTPAAAGSLAGTVSAAEDTSAIAAATVTLRNTEDGSARQVATDISGRFVFTDVPAGRFLVTATKPGFVGATFGAAGRGKPGLTLVQAAGQRMGGVDFRLVRGAAISGRVLDETGAPVAGANVLAIERVAFDAGAQYFRSGGAVTDDRGAYRIFGLAASSYTIVAARPDLGASPVAPDWARTSLTQTSGPPATTLPSGRGQAIPKYTPIFYPGTPDPALAVQVVVEAGTERTGVDVRFSMFPTAQVMGRLESSNGGPAGRAEILLTADRDSIFPILGDPRTRIGVSANGHFTFQGLNRGPYAVLARTSDTPSFVGVGPQQTMTITPGRGTPSSPVRWYAIGKAVVAGDRFVPLETMRLLRGAVVSGHVVFEGADPSSPPAAAARTGIRLIPAPDADVQFELPPERINADGLFTFGGLPPGRYIVDAITPSSTQQAARWHIESAVAAQHDVLDALLDVQPGEHIRDLTIVLTTGRTELTGRVVDRSGRPALDYYVTVFSVDDKVWKPQSRWIRGPVRVASDGSYQLVNLPPGEYFVATTSEAAPSISGRPEWLRQLVPTAIRIKIARGERKRQDLRIDTGGARWWFLR